MHYCYCEASGSEKTAWLHRYSTPFSYNVVSVAENLWDKITNDRHKYTRRWYNSLLVHSFQACVVGQNLPIKTIVAMTSWDGVSINHCRGLSKVLHCTNCSLLPQPAHNQEPRVWIPCPPNIIRGAVQG